MRKGWFQKGNTFGKKNKGQKHPWAKGLPQLFKKGSVPWVKGKSAVWNKRPMSEETKSKISEAMKGRKPVYKATKEIRKKMSDSHKKKPNRYWLGKHRVDMIGEKNPSWKGGITPINHLIRNSVEYKLWRKSVFERDNYTCIWCGKIGGKLNADHIKTFAEYPELRFAIDNGRTLCRECHIKTHSNEL